MTAASVLALCAARGVRLEPAGDGFRVHGPKSARAELKPLVLEHKAELLDLLKRPALPGTTGTTITTTPVTTAPTRRALPPDGPQERWAYDWRGRPVNLFGLRPGEDGRPPVFVVPKPEGLQ
jgi:hypothetical protein